MTNRCARKISLRTPTILFCVALLGLAACDRPSGTDPAGKDPAAVVERMPASGAGEPIRDVEKDSIAQFAQATDDMLVTAKVQVALNAEPSLHLLPISVYTLDGVVTLSGPVSVPAHRAQAEAITASVSGVQSVDNQIVVDGT